MSTTTTKTREEMIQDLHDFAEALKSNEAAGAQLQSLDKAAEVMALYENRTLDGEPLDRRWQDEVPAPKRRRGSAGATEQVDSFNRFILKWATEQTGLKASTLRRFARAYDVQSHLPHPGNAQEISIKALDPFAYFVREDKTDQIQGVWQAATELAREEGYESPGEAFVKRAITDWKRDNLPKSKRGSQPKLTPRRRVKELEGELRRWVSSEPTLTVPMIRQVLADFEAKVASQPPVEEWSS